MSVPFCQMSEGMENVLSDHTDGFVLFEQLPFLPCIGDHTLHHIVDWNEIGKKTLPFVILHHLQL